MIVQSCTFTVHFPKNARIRESLFALEEHFVGFQKPFTLVPLPQEAPLDIPRIIAVTNQHHSQLIFTGNSAQLVTTFDENYNTDISKCIAYVQSKCDSIIAALKVIGSESDGKPKFYFSGLSISLLFDHTDGIDNPIQYVSEKFLNCHSNLLIDESQLRLAFVVDNEFYVNVMVQNHRQFANGPDERGSFANSEGHQDFLQVIMDINDRYAFNHTSGYLSSEESVNKVIHLAEVFSKTHINQFIKDGELEYADN